MFVVAVIFLLGYLVVTLEHPLRIEKAAAALVTGGLCWLWLTLDPGHAGIDHLLEHHLVEIAGIVFFLLAAMTIVEVIEGFDGFRPLIQILNVSSKRTFFVLIALLTFGLSAILDNLATTLVMLALISKKLDDEEDLKLFAGMIVIAANAGGAFSPIGDVTTTMLWIGGQVTFPSIVYRVFWPSFVSFIVPLFWLARQVKGSLATETKAEVEAIPGRTVILVVGVGFLVAVPVLKTLLHVPPYLSLLTGLGVLWVLTELLAARRHRYKERRSSLPSALQKIDLPSILFFIGILLAVAALDDAGALAFLAQVLVNVLGGPHAIAAALGVLSSVFDNVPLVAGAARMFTLEQFPPDSPFWQWLAFAAGTGGSLLVVGSAAGIAAMGFTGLRFGWYAKKIGFPAAVGFAAGLGVLLTGL